MAGWREDIKIIRFLLTGTQTEGWRADLRAIAGGNPASWRGAVRSWANSHAVPAQSWRSDLIGISLSLVAVPPKDWREALRFIRLFYEGNPPEILRLRDNGGNALFDNGGNDLFVRF